MYKLGLNPLMTLSTKLFYHTTLGIIFMYVLTYLYNIMFLGTLLLVSTQTEDSDVLWTMSTDSFPFQSQLMEAQVTIFKICSIFSVKTYSP